MDHVINGSAFEHPEVSGPGIFSVDLYSGDPNSGPSNYGNIQIMDYRVPGSPCPIIVRYSVHDLKSGLKLRYSDDLVKT